MRATTDAEASGAAPPTVAPPGTAPASVSFEGVSKWFGDVVAVSDVSFRLYPGLTALLGPNGAGKSTVLRLACGLTSASRGAVQVLGRNPRTDLPVRRQLGIAPQQESMFDHQTAFEFVQLAASLYGVADPDGAARWALGHVGLDPDLRRRIATYSKGMRQRVKLAQAIVADPHVVVLDEPLTGLDPRQRVATVELLRRIAAAGRCVVVSSHVLEEVERLGSRILVIAQGRLAAEGDFRAIRNLMDDRPRRLRIGVEPAAAFGAELLRWGLASGVRVTGPGALEVDTTNPAGLRRWVATLARELGCRLWEIAPLDEDLESVFRYLTEGR